MHGKGMPQARFRDPAIENGVIRRMKHRIPDPGDKGNRKEHDITLRRSQQKPRCRQKKDAGKKYGLGANPVDHQSGERLPDPRDHEKNGYHHPDFGIRQPESGHQPRKERWNKQVKEMRDGMRKADEGDGCGIVVGAGRLDDSIHDGNQKGGAAATDADSKPEP